MEQMVRQVLKTARLSVDTAAVTNDQNLFDLGLSSFACVQLMMSIEDAAGIEFPDEMLRRETFESIDAIIQSINALRTAA